MTTIHLATTPAYQVGHLADAWGCTVTTAVTRAIAASFARVATVDPDATSRADAEPVAGRAGQTRSCPPTLADRPHVHLGGPCFVCGAA